MDIEEEKSSKLISAFIAMLFGIVIALPIIGIMYDEITSKGVFAILGMSCILSFILNYFFPNLYYRILSIFGHIDF